MTLIDNPGNRALIVLYIDPESYARESEAPLTKERLAQIGQDVNDDASPIYGYESWDTIMPAPKDHEHCRELGECWQHKDPCPALEEVKP